MNSALDDMMSRYNCSTPEDYRFALKEIVQELALLGLFRAGFYSKAAFYGGTALRIFYGLDRFSEGLDFSLIEPDSSFDLSTLTKVVQDELGAFGLEMTVTEKIKRNDSPLKSAFIKGGTQIHILKIASVEPPVKGIHPDEKIRIKMEVDTEPPEGAEYEMKYQLQPIPYSVRLYRDSSLFAGKIHALLCRTWQTRVKGRDFYDYIWFLANEVPVNMVHLQARMRQTGHLGPDEMLTEDVLKNLLVRRFTSVDMQQAKKDVLPYIKDPKALELWSPDFFISITMDKLLV